MQYCNLLGVFDNGAWSHGTVLELGDHFVGKRFIERIDKDLDESNDLEVIHYKLTYPCLLLSRCIVTLTHELIPILGPA